MKTSTRSLLQIFIILAFIVGIFGLGLQTQSVIAKPAAQTTNLALNKPVTCSSLENANLFCAKAVDGNTTTRWSSAFSDPQWIYVDLGTAQSIGRVVLRWQNSYGRSYQIQTSTNATSWTTIYSTTTGDGGVDDLTVTGSGRYIRMYGTARFTQYGYSLWEFEVYGGGSTLTPTATRTNTPVTGSLPDLTITSVTYVGSTPPCANQPRDNVVVSNIGSVGAGSFVVSFGPSMTQTVSSLAAGASVTLSFPAIMGTATATADSTNVIVESNESNNSMTASLPAPTQAPTCTPTRTNTPVVATLTPTRTPTRTNTPVPGGSVMLSYHAPAVVSTFQNDAFCVECNGDKVVDMDMSTRWASAWADPQWIYLDLGATANITRVVLKWQGSYAKSYQIQTSPNATTWTNIYSTTTSDGATDDLTVSGSGRYVRMYGTVRANSYGYSMYEFEVYGTGGAPQATATPRPTSTPHGPWILDWSDEFNGPAIDLTNWNYETGCTGYGNGEWENYTNGANSAISFDAQANSNVMIIEARQTGAMAACGYTSSRMNTKGKREFTYGRIEARLKLPQTQGVWPAFWMMGNNISTVGWPYNGEIDIMEHIGSLPTTSSGALHGPGYSGGGNIGGAFTHSEPVNLNYHLYAIEWSPDQVKWFVDSNNFLTVTRDQVQTKGAWVYDHPFFILLNVAVGGAWPGNPTASSVFPQRMYVDYIRVYR